jgi:hypothetical protein
MDVNALIALHDQIANCGSIERLAYRLLCEAELKKTTIYTLLYGKSGQPVIKAGICENDEDGLIRLFVGNIAPYRHPLLKRSRLARSQYTQSNVYNAAYYNLVCRIARAMYELPLDELPLFVNCEMKAVAHVLKDRFSEPWLTEDLFYTAVASEKESQKNVLVNCDQIEHAFFNDNFPYIVYPKKFPLHFWRPSRSIRAYPRPGQGFHIARPRAQVEALWTKWNERIFSGKHR